MSNVVAFKDRSRTAEFDCIECGQAVVSFAHPDDRPICGICRHLPGWRQDENGRLAPAAGER